MPDRRDGRQGVDQGSSRNVATSGTKIRVLLADDNPEILQEICSLLAAEFDLVATANNGILLVAEAQKFKPDIVVSDIGMPELNGIEASRRILELGCCKTIVVLTVSNSPEVVKTAFEAGIRGYVLKENAGEELIGAIHCAVEGKAFLSPEIVQNGFRKQIGQIRF